MVVAYHPCGWRGVVPPRPLALPQVGAADEALYGFRRPALVATSQRLRPDRRRNAVSLRHTPGPLVLVAPADRCMARLRGRSQTQAAIGTCCGGGAARATLSQA